MINARITFSNIQALDVAVAGVTSIREESGRSSLGDAVAPMPGVIEKVAVEDGAVVAAGDPLIVMIAMKMEYVIKAPKAGTVKKVNTKLGDFVEKGKVLVSFAEDE